MKMKLFANLMILHLLFVVTGEEEIEDYWFFCNQWFARSEGDHKIVRELLPTTEEGDKLTDLEGEVMLPWRLKVLIMKRV